MSEVSNNKNTDVCELVRLQKYMSRCGVASRRACEGLISEGHVRVNGDVVTKLGTKINPSQDIICVNGSEVKELADDITIMLNKPAGYVSTMKDPQGRPVVADLIPVDTYPNIFPVGRLDRLTAGMLVFTTDGQLAQTLLHPKNQVNKTYEAVVVGRMEDESDAVNKLRMGVDIGGFVTSPSELKIISTFNFDQYLECENSFFDNCGKGCSSNELPGAKNLIDKEFSHIQITIHEGKNRQVRKMFESVGFHVLLLRRTKIGNLTMRDLEPGKWVKLELDDIDKMEIR